MVFFGNYYPIIYSLIIVYASDLLFDAYNNTLYLKYIFIFEIRIIFSATIIGILHLHVTDQRRVYTIISVAAHQPVSETFILKNVTFI